MPLIRKLLAAFNSVMLVIIATGSMAVAQGQLSKAESMAKRSKDTHAIDLVPIFDIPGESPTRTVEKAAQRQIEKSIQTDKDKDNDNDLDPNRPGKAKVMVTTQQKMDASKESTNVGKDNPADKCQAPTDAEVRRPTLALALGGGGARGAAHIGVLRVFEREGIPIDYIVGNSMGSIVGGLYAAGVSLDDIEKIMTNGSLRKAYMPWAVPPKLLLSPLEKMMHPLKKHYAGLWTGKKFGDFLEKQLPRNVVNVEDTPLPFSAVATNLIDGKAYRISNGKLSTAMRASSTIPTLLQPVAIGDKVYVDGGVRANLPASAARDTGADIVIAILVDEPLRVMPARNFQHLSGIYERLTDVMLAVADARQLPFADIIINPDVSGISVLKGHQDDARMAIVAGEVAAQKALPEIRKRMALPVKQAAVAAKKGSESK